MSSVPLATPQPAAAIQPESQAVEPEAPRMAPDQPAAEAAPSMEVFAEAAPPMEVFAEAAPPMTASPEVTRPVEVSAEAARPMSAVLQLANPRTQIAVTLGVVLLVALAWAGLHAFGTHPSSAQRPLAVESPGALAAATSGARGPAEPAMRARGSDNFGTVLRASNTTASPPALHQEIPEVPHSALRTIHGHIKVWVRVIINQDGSVLAAVVDRPGPSRYFERLALRAAKEWTFPSGATSSRRLMQIRFEFGRDGARGRAVSLN